MTADQLRETITYLEQVLAEMESNPPETRVFDMGGGVYESEDIRVEFKDGQARGQAFDVQVDS